MEEEQYHVMEDLADCDAIKKEMYAKKEVRTNDADN